MKATTITLSSAAILALVGSVAVGVGAENPDFHSPFESPSSPISPMPTTEPEALQIESIDLSQWSLLGYSIATYFGNEVDGFLGKRHASSWHNKTPAGFSEVVVDCCEPGAAMSITWGIEFGEEVLVVWKDTGLAVRAIRVDTKPGFGVDLYEWLYRTLSPRDIGPLKVAVYAREKRPRPIMDPASERTIQERSYILSSDDRSEKERLQSAEENHNFRSPLYPLRRTRGGIPRDRYYRSLQP